MDFKDVVFDQHYAKMLMASVEGAYQEGYLNGINSILHVVDTIVKETGKCPSSRDIKDHLNKKYFEKQEELKQEIEKLNAKEKEKENASKQEVKDDQEKATVINLFSKKKPE